MNPNLPLLKAVPLFRGYSDEDLEETARLALPRKLKAGQYLFHLGDPGHSLFVIVSGGVDVVLPSDPPGGTPTLLQHFAPGEFFGEIALLDDETRTASVVATVETELLEITKQSFLAQLARSPQLVPSMLAVMSNRLRATTRLVGSPVARNVNEEADEQLTWGQRIADVAARWNGSWAFILTIAVLTAVWVVAHGPLGLAVDPFPYPFFNLFLALLVAMQGPLLMMSQNRQIQKERLQADADYRVNLKNEIGIDRILHELAELRAEVTRLRELQQAGDRE